MLAVTGSAAAMILLIGGASSGAAQQPEALSTDIEVPTEYTAERETPDDDVSGLVEDAAVARIREEASEARGRRLIVSLEDRLIYWMDGADTLHVAPIAIGKGTQLQHEDQRWDFSTPRGVRRLLSKQENPVWSPPDWHYIELARDSGLVVLPIPRETGARLLDGSKLVVRGDRIGRQFADGRFELIPEDEEVVFGDTLFVPPHGTANRRIEGELGAHKLDLGDGYMIHGTPHKTSIGTAATHGCIRMRDGDLEYLYYRVPIGTPVYIY